MTGIVLWNGHLAADRTVTDEDNWVTHYGEKIFISTEKHVAISVLGDALDPSDGVELADKFEDGLISQTLTSIDVVATLLATYSASKVFILGKILGKTIHAIADVKSGCVKQVPCYIPHCGGSGGTAMSSYIEYKRWDVGAITGPQPQISFDELFAVASKIDACTTASFSLVTQDDLKD